MPLEVIKGIPLFAGLEPRELEDFLRIFRRASFDMDACLVRQGQQADSAFILESGVAEVVTALPGGGQAVVAELGPGSVLGEMALLDSGVRSATVIARVPTTGYLVERDSFRTLLAQCSPAVFKVQRCITLTLCQRLRALNARIVASSGNGSVPPHTAAAEAQAPLAQRTPCAFDYRAFLPMLPVFRRFSAEDIDGLTAQAEVFDLPRGQTIFYESEASLACYIVVRGAIEIAAAANGRRRRIGILGPGRLCGVLALIDGQPHSMTALAREHATLMEIDRTAFARIYDDHTQLAARFHDAINQELLQALARTNNHLTRLISQARIRARHDAQIDVEELRRTLCTQDCRAA
jgi:CRP/FNR family cyclic AMP-dependent transcriptional regulator